jgi:hypothetical protein
MTTHLVCFADERFHRAQLRLIRSTASNGIDVVHAFGPLDLKKTAFYAENRRILDQSRGCGYWLWKPFFIREVLRKANVGDFVVYVDSGAELVAPTSSLVECCREEGGVLLFRNHGHPNRYWTKRDCFVLMGCDREEAYDRDQANAAFICFLAGSDAERFVDAWLAECVDPRKITDQPNEAGLPNLPEFIAHQGDQPILSLLAFKQGRFLFRDPSQGGNHLKPVEFQTPGESLASPRSPEPYPRSPYPTVFNHHRDVSKRATPVERAVSIAKGIVWRFIPRKARNPYFTSADLADAIARNREILRGVPTWFDAEADAGSQFGYGVPDFLREKLNQPVGPEANLPDLIGHLVGLLEDRLNYLEVGVSVGKNLFQLARSGKRQRMVGFDIEEIHPNLSKRFIRSAREEWTPSTGSAKRGASSLTSFVDEQSGSKLRYLAADVFDEASWEKLRGERFNFIFSDALHTPEGLMHEWKMIRKFDLLDLDEFVMVWDDLGGFMTTAFDQIANQVHDLAGPCKKLLFPLRGWMGQNESPHEIGLLAKLKKAPAWLSKIPAWNP